MARNDELAASVRERLERHAVASLNLVSSPGSGKTLLLERTLASLGDELTMAVVTGDVQTQNDADRLAKHTSGLVQAVVTHGACHLDARQVQESLDVLDLDKTDILFVENVGNLVCPASWDLGEEAKVVIFSVTEGEDKPLKYPLMFQAADLMLINKIDLLPHINFDLEQCKVFARQVNPQIQIMELSCHSGSGMQQWYDWLVRGTKRKRN